ncbi:putative histone-lysine N-methyltransferase transcription regulator PHD family [Medicago truncatula]|uniref:[histone H3]-lysine(27) N-methyltransferase n=1 Tax=Medicago truncatula TaxID=3880 RepID=G7JBG7_MEDTR|nr:probable Histone-lysine N-methyltransferase ATXR5 [Medicago truncatula]AES72827.2 histone-lysine N-methyltransferase ATXR6-like protein [Medicago truncatula]RHN69907.1 putative histone-lysine N-methyltransferase transcription regulator PHD family [Medicago truncatula]
MAPATAPASPSPSSIKLSSLIRRTHAPHKIQKKLSYSSSSSTFEEEEGNKLLSLVNIYKRAEYTVGEEEDYGDLLCEQCGSGEQPEELLLCDKCDNGFHMKCVRPIVVRVPIGPWICPKCSDVKVKKLKKLSQKKILDFFGLRRDSLFGNNRASSQDAMKRRRRPRPLVVQKKRRRLLPFVPTEDPDRRLKQMASLATALTALDIEFSNKLTYFPGMAPRSANRSILENGGMQGLTKEDTQTLKRCIAMTKQGQFPPLMVVYDSCQGYTVEADGPIKDMTFIAEYTGDVDYIKKRESDDCDSMMTLLIATEAADSLVICADKRGNIARFISGINNHTQEGRKKQNCKCVRYDVKGESRVLLVATRDISKGERLYYDYNGYVHEYPTHHFV